MAGIVDSWSLIGNNYYIKYHFYNMKWQFTSSNFNKYLFAHGTYGGSIAAISKSSSNQELMVFSPSGTLLSNIMWKDAPVIDLYWSEDEKICLLQKSGRVAIHNLHCDYIKYVGMGDTVKKNSVRSHRFFTTIQGTGLMVLTEYNEIFYKLDLLNTDSIIKPIRNSSKVLTDSIIDWVAFTDLQDLEIMAIFALQNSIIKLKSDKEPQIFNQGSSWFSADSKIVKLALTMSKQRMAIALDNGKIFVMTSDMGHFVCNCDFEFVVNENDNVQMEWAGEDFLVLYHQDYLYLMDTSKQSTSSIYLDEPLMFPEIDGVRLVSVAKNEFIQKVPRQLEQIYQFSSEAPAMLLFEAQQHLDNKKSDAVHFLELILAKKGQMQDAIDTCLTAAANCLEPKWQKVILNAVHLGRSYIPDYRSDQVEEIHKKLLLLNNLKIPHVAMPLTMRQLDTMTKDVLLDRLINRRYYPFVERICTHLRIPKDQGINRMLEVWANEYIKRPDDEYLLASRIVDRLKDHWYFIHYAKLAAKACALNKLVLAEKLLDLEGSIKEKVRILMMLNKANDALTRSIESGDSDLISSVVFHLQAKLTYQEFITLIQKHPVAKAMYIENILDPNSPDFAKSKQSLGEDNLANQTEIQLKKLLSAENLQWALSAVNSVQEKYRHGNNEFMVQIIDDEKVLLQSMCTIAKNSDNVFCNMSVHDYLSFLFKNRLYEKAESIKQKLKVSDRQFYWIKLNTCAKTDNWDEFDLTISKWSKKTLVSYYDIGEICAEYQNEAHLNKYMDKIEPDKRVRLLVKIDKLAEAESLARHIKNEYLIHYVTALKI